MNLIITSQEFDTANSRALIPLKCEICHNTFYGKKHQITAVIKNPQTTHNRYRFCSLSCAGKHKTKLNTTMKNCKHCGKEIKCSNKNTIRIRNVFCSKSCSATYYNTHKTVGHRRSKLEKWMETNLMELYPTLDINFNKTDAINSELDIYIPSLKLAFELNGIFHYEPIYGKDKLEKIKNNDTRKFQACLENGIELCIIDTSKIVYLKESTARPILNVITNIIDGKLDKIKNEARVDYQSVQSLG